MKDHIEESSMRAELNFGQSRDRFVLKLAIADASQTAGPLGHEHFTARKKDHAPRTVQAVRKGDDSNFLSVGFELHTLALILSWTCGCNEGKRRRNEEERNGSRDRQFHEQRQVAER